MSLLRKVRKMKDKPKPQERKTKVRPVPDKYPVSNPYGKPGPYIIGYHTGTDFACPVGTPVKVPHDGVVIEVGNSPEDYGLFIKVVGTGDKRAWLFAHLSKFPPRIVGGARVERGEVIAYSGNTGDSTGPHVHCEERHAPYGYRDCQKPTAWNE